MSWNGGVQPDPGSAIPSAGGKRTSMRYRPFSTIRVTPDDCPATVRSRVRISSFWFGPVLEQLSAVTAAIAVLVVSDQVDACVRDVMESGDSDEQVTEVVTAVRRYVRSR